MACLKGYAAEFFLEPVVRHHHRRKRREGERLERRFAHGRGAFWVALLSRHSRLRHLVLRGWYWAIRSSIRTDVIRGMRDMILES